MNTVVKGTTSQPFDVDVGQTVTATPGSGGSMLVEYTTDEEVAIRNNSATWQAWTAGTVGAETSDVCMYPLYARVTAYTASGSYAVTGSGLQDTRSTDVVWKRDVGSPRNADYAAAVVGAAGLRATTIQGQIDDAPTVAAGGVLIYTAIIDNPLPLARSNQPTEIKLAFPDGVCAGADCIRVRDSGGAYVDWQWDGARHARTDVDVSTHASTNLAYGSAWIMVPNIAARGSVTYTVEVWPAAQSQSFTAAIALTTSAGVYDQYDHADFTIRFLESWTWNLAYWLDKTSSRDVMADADAGVEVVYKNASGGAGGTDNRTGLMLGSRQQTSSSHGEIAASSLGYGVVFREYRSVSVGSVHTTLQNNITYRVFANGVVMANNAQIVLTTLASTDNKQFYMQVAFSKTGATQVFSNTEAFEDVVYSNARTTQCIRSIKGQSDADGSAAAGSEWPGTGNYHAISPPRLRGGSQNVSQSVLKDARRSETFMMRVVPADMTFADARLDMWHPLVTTAAAYSDRRTQLARLGAEIRSFTKRYIGYGSPANEAVDWHHVLLASAWAANALMTTNDQWSLVPSRIQDWLDWPGRDGVADSGLGDRLFAEYKAAASASGWEHVGRDLSGFYMLWLEAGRRGDSDVRQTCAAIIGAIARFAELCVPDSVSEGYDSGWIILNYYDTPLNGNSTNAAAEAGLALALSESINGATSEQRRSLDAIWSVMLTFMEGFGAWPPYLYTQPTSLRSQVYNQVLSYFDRVCYTMHIIPTLTGRHSTTFDALYALRASVNAAGQTLEHRDGNRWNRRGLAATLMHYGTNLAQFGSVSDIEQAIVMWAHVNTESAATEASPYPIDGWANNVARMLGDARSASMAVPVLQYLAY